MIELDEQIVRSNGMELANEELVRDLDLKDQLLSDALHTKDPPTSLDQRISAELLQTKRQILRYDEQIDRHHQDADFHVETISKTDMHLDDKVLDAITKMNSHP